MVLLLSGMSQVRAAFITITESVTATGSLGGIAFTGQPVTLTGVGDTSNVTNPSSGLFSLQSGLVMTVGVTGFPTATVTGLPQALVSQGTSEGGFFTASTATILTTPNSAFSTYTLSTSIGPVSGNPAINSGLPLATTGGSFIIDSTSGTSVYQAVVTPEPDSLWLVGMAVAGAAVLGRRAKGTDAGRKKLPRCPVTSMCVVRRATILTEFKSRAGFFELLRSCYLRASALIRG